MDAYAWGYLVGALFNLALWVALFVGRKDLRRRMAEMSFWAVVIGVPHEYLLWTRDWWHPPTLTRTVVGAEDVLYAIGTGGLLAVLCPVVLRRYAVAAGPPPGRVARLAPILVDFLTPLVLVPALGLHSFVACGVGVLLALVWVFVRRPDLGAVAAASAALGTAVGLPGYRVIEALFPGFIHAVWDGDALSGIRLAGVPVEDVAWYAYSAALFGVYYQYATGRRLGRQPSPAAGAGLHARPISD